MNILQPEHLELLLGVIRRRAAFGERDHAMLTLMGHTGLRVSELVGLNHDQLATGRQSRTHLTIPAGLGKGGHGRVVPLNLTAQDAVVRLVEFNLSRGFSVAPTAPLLVTRQHTRLGVRYVQKLVEMLRRQAELDRPITPHSLRRGFASQVAQVCRDPYQVQALLGHRKLQTSLHYVQVRPEELERAVAGLDEG